MTTTNEPTDRQTTEGGSTGQSTGQGALRTYRTVVTSRGMPAWTFVTLCQRMPIAMSPLALVYLGKTTTGSYAVGALMAGAFAFAEAVAAGPMGRRFDRRSAISELRIVLSLQVVALLALGIPALAGGAPPIWVMIALSGVAGGVASGAHGGLRALLLRTVRPELNHPALSLEATLTTLLWAIGPAIVGLVALLTSQVWPVLVIAAFAATGLLAAGGLHNPVPAAGTDQQEAPDVRVWKLSWPALLQEGAVLTCVGAAYTGLPSLLESVDADPGVAGPALAAFAVAGLVGGLVYGGRRWPGRYRQQSFVLIMVLTAIVALAVAAPTAVTIVGLIVVAGLAGTPALTARAAGMQEVLPERVWATGFSGLYAAGGVGFGVAGLILATLLSHVGVRWAMFICIAMAALATVVSGMAESKATRNAAAKAT